MLQSIKHTHVESYTQAQSQSQLNLIHVADEVSATFELLKLLRHSNKQKGWTLLLAPDHVPSKTLLDTCSIDTSKLLVIRQKHLINLEYVLNSALTNGNFSAVVMWTNMMDTKALNTVTANSTTPLYCFVNNEEQLQPNTAIC